MTQQTKSVNLAKFEAGDRPTDQDFTDLFDSILFTNESNGLSSNKTILLGDLDIGGSLSILGGGNIAISGSFSAGDPTAGVAGGRISAFTATDSPPFYASSSISEVMFSGISSKTTSSIALTTKGSNELTSGDVRFGIENGKGFLDAQGTTVISYSTGSSATAGGDNIIHMSASVGIGKISPSYKLDVKGEGRFGVHNGILLTDDAGNSFVKAVNNSLNLFTSRDQDDIHFITGNTPTNKMFIEGNTGNVGIGTTSPEEKLHIEGTTGATRVLVETTTGNAQLRLKTNNNHFGLVSQGATDRLDIFDSNANTTPIKVVGGNPNNTLVLDGAGKIGIGTNSPSQKLDIAGGHIQLESGYGLGRSIGTSGDEYIIYPYLTGMPTSFTNITAQGSVGSNGMSLQSDKTISFIETDTNTLVGHMELDNNGVDSVFDWDGLINAEKFKGDGSQLTGITGGQIVGFVTSPGDNRLVTSNATGDAITGEANLTFDGSILTHLLGTGNTGNDGIILDGQAGGFINFSNGTSTSNEFLPFFQGKSSSTTSGTAGLTISGVPDTDSLNHPGIVLRGSNAAYTGVSIASDILRIQNHTTDLITIDKDGKMGIGTTTPIGQVHIATGPGTIATNDLAQSHLLIGSVTAGLGMDTNEIFFKGHDGHIGNISNNYLAIRTNAITRIHIAGGGDVGIGTTSPTSKLDVRGDIRIGSVPTMTLFDNNDTSLGPDILFNQTGLIAAEDALFFNFNSDGGSNDLFILSGGDTSAATEIARFTSAGQLGINNTDPGQRLTINGLTADIWDSGIGLKRNGTLRGYIIADDDGLKLRAASSGDHIYFRNSANDFIAIIYEDGKVSAEKKLEIADTTSGRDKIRVYPTSDYAIGFVDNTTYGGLGDWAMTFQVNDISDRGFWWGHSTHGVDEGAMALTTDGELTVAKGIRISSESDLTTPPTGISMTQPAGALTVGETRIGKGSGGALKIQSEFGFVQVGPQNAGHCHFSTDIGGFYFNDQIRVDGVIASYNQDLKLRRKYDDTGVALNEIVVTDGSTFFRQNNDIRFRVDNGNTWIDNKLWVGGDYQDHSGTTAIPTRDLAIGDGDTGFDNGGDGVLEMFSNNVGIGRFTNDSIRFFNADNGYMFGANAVPNSSATLHVKQRPKTGTNGNRGIVCEDDEGTGFWNIHFSSGTTTGTQDVTYGNVDNIFVLSFNGTGQNGGRAFSNTQGADGLFTGQHRNIPQEGDTTDFISKVGHIVSSTGNIQNQQGIEGHEVYRPNINESLPKVKLSDTIKDKKVYGVISDLEDPNSEVRMIQHGIWGSAYEKPEGDTRLIINSVGEGAIMVCNINGNIENGDYITTSHIEGLGMKQDDDLLHNYTVAKSVMDCDFSSNTNYVLGTTEHNGVTYKTALIGCTYHCG